MLDSKLLTNDFPAELFNYSLIHYINLSNRDYYKLLEYRNHDSVRSSMINTDLISMETHLCFRDKLLNQNLGYWALKREDRIIGSISLTNYNYEELSLIGGNFIAPSLIGSGFGAVANFLMHSVAFEHLLCEKLVSFVKVNNTNANRLNKLFGGLIVDLVNYDKNQLVEYYKYEFLRESWLNEIKLKTKRLVNYVI